MTPKITRRQFIAGSLAAGAAFYAPKLPADESKRIASLTDRVVLGKSGISASYLCFGTGTKGWRQESNQTRLGTVNFARMVRDAYDQGVNYFDLADIYGSHQYLRAAMGGIPREDYVVQTKIWYRTSKSAQEDLERFLRELRTEYIDILMIHSADQRDWHERQSEMMEVFENAKRKGLIRAHGVSIHSLAALETAAKNPWVDVMLARVNHIGEKMDAKPQEVTPVLEKAHSEGKGVVGMKILGEGSIAEERENSLRFVLGLDCVDSIVIGFESAEQVSEILNIGKRILNNV